MITRNSSEEQILADLIIDYKWAKSQMTKTAKKWLGKERKKGGVRPEYTIGATTKSPRGNNWFVQAKFLSTGKAEWRFSGVCKVDDTPTGIPDHYTLRGLRIERPYFVKFTGHCVKRMRQRMPYPEDIKKGMIDSAIVASAFLPHEVPTFAHCGASMEAYIRLVKNRNMMDSLIFYSIHGFYLGCHTPKGNFIINTYIHHGMLWGDMQNECTYHPMMLHYCYNDKYYGNLPGMRLLKENMDQIPDEFKEPGDTAHLLPP